MGGTLHRDRLRPQNEAPRRDSVHSHPGRSCQSPPWRLARGSAKITVFRSRAVSRKESGPEPMADRPLRVDSGRSQTARIEVPTDGSRPEEIYSLNSGGVDFCWLFFLRKRIRVKFFGSTRLTSRVAEPAHDPRRQRSDPGDAPRATARVRAHGASRKSVGARHDPRRRFLPWPNAGRSDAGIGGEIEAEIFRLAKP
jgi:hypothetical protein